ncbi:hypothetical protein ACEPAF_8729 [Sanghuangporus sanghuang]
MTDLRVWCLLIDHEKKAAFGDVFSVKVPHDAYVDDLKTKIKEVRPVALGHVNRVMLTVWRCMNPKLLAEVNRAQMEKNLSNVDLTDETKTEELGPGQEITSLGLSDGEVLLIQVPVYLSTMWTPGLTGKFDPIVVPSELERHARALALDPNMSQLFGHTTFLVAVESSGGATWSTVMRLNRYNEIPICEQFIVNVVTVRRCPPGPKLKSWLRTTMQYFVENVAHRTTIADMIDNSGNDAIGYSEEGYELGHFGQGIAMTCRLGPLIPEFSRIAVWLLILDKFRNYWEMKVVQDYICERSLPFPLIAKAISNDGDERSCTYHIRPDFALLKDSFPYFLAEIDSKSNQKDIYRLRVQLACSLRLGLALRGETYSEEHNFFLMGAFFDSQWKVIRIFCYVNEQDKVCFNDKTYVITDIVDLTTFLFEFYNYAKHTEECNVGKRSADILAMDEVAKKAGMKRLYNKRNDGNQAPKGVKRPRTGEDREDQEQRNDQDREREGIVDALQKANFRVQSINYDSDLVPWARLPNHVVQATSSKGERVIAKLVLGGFSNELSFLKQLNTACSSLNHVIPLVETLKSAAGLLLILPKKTPILSLFPDILDHKSMPLSRQLIEGVAFLHRHKIAHLDIKPDNLVWDRALSRLYIIDFDIAVRCRDIDEMVEISCGTPGWSAPEIVHDEKVPLLPFNPIRADLWSCGAVLRYFGRTNDKAINLLTSLLLDPDPRRRPLLHELVDEEPDFWSSGRLLGALVFADRPKGSCTNDTG